MREENLGCPHPSLEVLKIGENLSYCGVRGRAHTAHTLCRPRTASGPGPGRVMAVPLAILYFVFTFRLSAHFRTRLVRAVHTGRYGLTLFCESRISGRALYLYIVG